MREIENRIVDNNITEIFSIDVENGSERKCYRIDKQKKEIICYIEDSDFLLMFFILMDSLPFQKSFLNMGTYQQVCSILLM